MPDLAVARAVLEQLEAVQRQPVVAGLRLHRPVARAELDHAEAPPVRAHDLAAERHRQVRAWRSEADVDHVGYAAELHDADPVGQAGVRVPREQHAPEEQRRLVAELGEHLEHEAVLLEAVAAAVPHDDAVVERGRVERQVVAEARADARERERRDMAALDLGEQVRRRVAGLEVEGGEVRRRQLSAVHASQGARRAAPAPRRYAAGSSTPPGPPAPRRRHRGTSPADRGLTARPGPRGRSTRRPGSRAGGAAAAARGRRRSRDRRRRAPRTRRRSRRG